ncbi:MULTISPECIES: Z1 domain-containing protein [unclassified Rathayibacter]|uniref:Z1 domain-containing protein n=1 Tax=unclassified Rathayibacter TaxID=2609250 RepID=UPI0015E3DCA2|nr:MULTISPECIES: Z1 domain-containing protein [unclassified Rathayibacter]
MTTIAVEKDKKKLLDMLTSLLVNDSSIQLDDLETKARLFAPIVGPDLQAGDVDAVIARVTELQQVTLDLGPVVFDPKTFKEWLEERKKTTETKRWNAYQQLLVNREWSPTVVRKLDEQTDIILERMGDPKAGGEWARRGLVIGEVQSGKTATYLGILNKAIDYGYKIIVVIGGHTEDLRRQTQQRLDKDMTGVDSVYIADNIDSRYENMRIGVGAIDGSIQSNILTTTRSDFSAASKNAGVVALGGDTPTIFVVKKNARVLANLANYLVGQANQGKLTAPLIVVDDEADWASVNTKTEDDAAAVNRVVRRLLATSSRSSYLGITATPFANVLIDDSVEEDLFPRDFIQALESPSNYTGVEAYFGRDTKGSDPRIRTDVQDCLEVLPFTHKRTAQIDELPGTLVQAISAFLVGTAIRRRRDGSVQPASMMINVSRFNDVQSNVTAEVQHFVDDVRRAVLAEYAMPEDEVGDTTTAASILKETFDGEFADEASWAELRPLLLQIVEEVSVVLVNSGTMGPRNKRLSEMSREDREAESRLPTIFVGGDVLARGLTLEGLQISYFVRKAAAADTLLQMGRWFGYRPGYEDLVRVWIDSTVVDLFKYVADVSDDLRGSLRLMNSLKMTPQQFGLKMRRHPEAFLITAANKQKHAAQIEGEVDIDGASFESHVLSIDSSDRRRNLDAAKDLVSALQEGAGEEPDETRSSMVWSNVPSEVIARFFSRFRGHDSETFFGQTSKSGGKAQLAAHLADAVNSETWDVGFVEGQSKTKTEVLGLSTPLSPSIRNNLEAGSGKSVRFGNRRVAAGADLRNAMKKDRVLELERDLERGTAGKRRRLSDQDVIRGALERPLLLVFTVINETESGAAAREQHDAVAARDDELQFTAQDPLIAVVVAFPVSQDDAERAGSKKNRVARFVANTVFARLNLGLPDKDEPAGDEE